MTIIIWRCHELWIKRPDSNVFIGQRSVLDKLYPIFLNWKHQFEQCYANVGLMLLLPSCFWRFAKFPGWTKCVELWRVIEVHNRINEGSSGRVKYFSFILDWSSGITSYQELLSKKMKSHQFETQVIIMKILTNEFPPRAKLSLMFCTSGAENGVLKDPLQIFTAS